MPAGTGRPGLSALTLKGERTRQRVIAAAAQLVLDRGLGATTVEDVRAAAGVSSSQACHYFTDKDALVRAVIDDQTQAVVGARNPSLPPSTASRRCVNGAMGSSVTSTAAAAPVGSLGSELAETGDPARARLSASFTHWETAIRGGQRAMHARGALRAGANPRRPRNGHPRPIAGRLRLAKIQRTTRPLEAALDAMLAHIAACATPPQPRRGPADQGSLPAP